MFSSLEMDLGNCFQPGKKEKRLKKKKEKNINNNKKTKTPKQTETNPPTHA